MVTRIIGDSDGISFHISNSVRDCCYYEFCHYINGNRLRILLTNCGTRVELSFKSEFYYRQETSLYHLLNEVDNIGTIEMNDETWREIPKQNQYILFIGKKYLKISSNRDFYETFYRNHNEIRVMEERNYALMAQHDAIMMIYLIWMNGESKILLLLPYELIECISGYILQWPVDLCKKWKRLVFDS